MATNVNYLEIIRTTYPADAEDLPLCGICRDQRTQEAAAEAFIGHHANAHVDHLFHSRCFEGWVRASGDVTCAACCRRLNDPTGELAPMQDQQMVDEDPFELDAEIPQDDPPRVYTANDYVNMAAVFVTVMLVGSLVRLADYMMFE